MLDQLSTCEQKLVLLIEELSSHELDTLQKEMEDDEVGLLEHALTVLG